MKSSLYFLGILFAKTIHHVFFLNFFASVVVFWNCWASEDTPSSHIPPPFSYCNEDVILLVHSCTEHYHAPHQRFQNASHHLNKWKQFSGMGALFMKKRNLQFSQTKWGIHYTVATEVIIMHGYLLNNCSAHSVRLFSSNFPKRYFRFRQQEGFTGGEGSTATTIFEVVLIFKFMHEARLALSVCTVASRFPIGITSVRFHFLKLLIMTFPVVQLAEASKPSAESPNLSLDSKSIFSESCGQANFSDLTICLLKKFDRTPVTVMTIPVQNSFGASDEFEDASAAISKIVIENVELRTKQSVDKTK